MSDSAGPARGQWPFRPWEVVVITIALVLFVIAFFAGPEEPPVPVAVPTSTPSDAVVASSSPAPATGSPVPTPSPGASASATPAPNPTPVASIDQIVAEEVGDYVLVDRRPDEDGPLGGAIEADELRYSLGRRSRPDSAIFHAIEVHVDATAADERVRIFADAMKESGFNIVREQPLRSDEGERQGYFISLRAGDQELLLWSNQNVTFSLAGAKSADVEAFYDMLPY